MKKVLGSFYPAVLFLMPVAFAEAQAPAPPEPGVTIHQTVQEVVLEVMVRDARGRVVKNLKPSDLEVYEDGVRQQIQSFKFIEGREVMSQTSKVPAPVTQRAAGVLQSAESRQSGLHRVFQPGRVQQKVSRWMRCRSF